MKHLTLLLACGLALCLSASAQFTPQQYPFPYNPDSNQDGMVSMTDFLEILGLFGQEFPNSFYSDSTRAVLDLGEMGAIQCVQQAEAAGADWRILSVKDIYDFAPLMVNTPNIEEGYYLFHYWSPELNFMNVGYLTTDSEAQVNDWVYNTDSTLAFRFGHEEVTFNAPLRLTHLRRCYLVTEVRPTILYTAPNYEWQVEDLLNDGWQPLGNANGFWKEAE